MDRLKNSKLKTITMAVSNAMQWPTSGLSPASGQLACHARSISSSAPRILIDKALIAAMLVALAAQPTPVFAKTLEPLTAVQRRVAHPATPRNIALAPPVASPAVAATDSALAPHAVHAVVVVDSNVADYPTLIAGIDPLTPVIVLQPGKSGLSALAEALAGYHDLDAIHLVTEGHGGAIQLGREWVGSNALQANPDDLQAIATALKAGGDLLLYGCSVAQGVAGRQFVHELAQLLGHVDVAASTNPTGPTELGGDWDLEYASGEVEAVLPFSLVGMRDFDHTLGCTASADHKKIYGPDGTTQWLHNDSGFTWYVDHALTWTFGGTSSQSVGAGLNGTFDGYQDIIDYVQECNAVVPTVTLAVNNATIAEAAGTSTITATLSAAAATDTTVNLATSGTATGGGSDYTLSSTSITIAAGQTTGTATITAAQDTRDEADETVIVDISSVSGGGGATENATQQVTVTITDDDAAPSLSIANASTTEGNSGTKTLTFTVTLSAASGRTVTVNYATSNGTATAGSDYTAASGTLTFNAGDTSKTFNVTLNGDTTGESDETFTVTLSSPTNATLGTATASGTISNDDNAVPTFTVFAAAIDTGNEDSEVELTLAEVKAQGDEADSDGTVDAFVVQAVSTGTLRIGASAGAATAYAAGSNDTIDATHNAYWTPAANANGTLNAFTVKAKDNGGALSATAVQATVSVTAINDAPSASGSATLTAVAEDVSTAAPGATIATLFGANFSDAADSGSLIGVAISSYTPDAAKGEWQYQVNGTGAWTALGSATIATAITLASTDLLRFVPAANYSGAATALSVNLIKTGAAAITSGATINLTGATGAGTYYSSATVSLGNTVNTVADTPTITSASTTPSTQTGSGLVIGRNAADGAEVTHFKITAISNGTLYQNDGTTQINNNDFITYAQGQAGLKFTPSGSSDGSFVIQASKSNGDGGLGGSTVTASVTVGVAVASPTINEDSDSGAIAINGATNNYKITAISGGTLYSDNTYTTAINSGDFIATAGATTNVYFRPTANFNGAAGFSVQGSSSASDGGLTGNTAVSTITVTAIADTPTVASPTINENADSGAIAITRNASDGTETTRYQITAITGGTLYSDAGYTTAITNNAYVTSGGATTNVYFRPTANRNTTTGGNASFTVQAASATAVGGSTVTSTIVLTPIAATPSAASPTISEDADSGAIVITRAASDGAEITYYKITGISGGTLYSDAGFTTPISNGSFIASAGATTNVYFRPTANATTAGSFTVQASTSNADGGLGGSTATSTVGITPVADAPSVTGTSTTPSTQTSSGLVISRNAADGAEVSHFKITAISNGSLFKNNGTTAINNGDFITYAEGQAGLKFTPSGSSDGSFAIWGATSSGGAGLSATATTATVTVGVAVASPTINEDTDSGAIAINGGTNNYKITAISGGTLYSDAGYTTAITSGSFIATAGATTNVYFRPTANFNGAAGFSVQGSSSAADGGLTGNTAVSTITVTAVKDAPTGLGNLTLAAINQGTAAPAGAAISALSGLNFTFVDSGSTLGGAAVIGNLANAATQGAWQYSTNAGTNWYDIGTVGDDATALALSAATLVRFMPVASYSGTPPVLTVRALDNTYVAGYSVAAGAETRVTLDSSANGGTTAVSGNTNTISTSVTAPAPAPAPAPTTTILPTGGGTATLTGGQSVTVTENGKDGTSIALPPPPTTTGGAINSVSVTLPGTGTIGVSSDSVGTQLGVTKVTLPGATTAVNTVTVDQGSASFTASEKGQAVAGLKNGIVVVSGAKDSKVSVDATGTNDKIGGLTDNVTLVVPTGSTGVSGTKVDLPSPSASSGQASTVSLVIGGHELTITSTQSNTTMTFEMKNLGGVQTPVMAVTGSAQVSSSGEDKPLVSVAGNVIKSGKSSGSGGSHQVCNTIVQASSDASSDVVHVVTCYIVLEPGTFSALSGGIGNGFAAIKDGIVWAGETAEFDKAGIVTGAYLGTRAGNSSDVGDDIVPGNGKFTASGYTTNAFIPRLAGTPLRLNGAKLDESLFATVNRVLGTTTLPATPSQSAQGILTFQVGGDADAAQKAQSALTFDLTGDLVSVFPSRRIRVDTSRADGISVSTEGNVEVATGGLVTTFVPSVADPQGFAADVAAALPGSTSQMRWNGSWQVTGSDGTTYVGRPQWGMQSSASGSAAFSDGGAGNLRYHANGRSQLLFPDFHDYTTLQATFSTEFNDAALKVQPRMNGTAQATVLGKTYLLAPQWSLVPVAKVTGKPAWWLENNTVYIKNADGTAQGFTVP